MRTAKLIKTLVVVGLGISLHGAISESRAAIPRKTELAFQEKAPEHLHIDVLKVRKWLKGTYYTVTVTAKVLKVERSASGVKAGEEIKLVYSTPAVPIPSAPPGLVKKGQKLQAFLSKEADGTFDAAAASGTFEPIPAAKPAAGDAGGGK